MKTLTAVTVIAGALLCAPAWAQQQAAPPANQSAAQAPANGGSGSGSSSGSGAPVASVPVGVSPSASATSANGAGTGSIVVASGTRLPLILHNSISTRNAHPGDPVYLETTFPIVQNDRILIPAGSYVQGEVIDAKRAGKVKGQGEVRIRLTTLILPNGYTASFDAVPTNAGTGGNESSNGEGQIKGDTDRAADVGTVVKTTAVGAGVGAVAARSAAGAGIGAGAGAALGLAMVMLTRGPEAELPRGTSVDIELDRPLYLDSARINFTDPGHASTLPGPASREPARTRPF